MKSFFTQLLIVGLLVTITSDLLAQRLTYGVRGGMTGGVIIGPFNPDTDKGKPVLNPNMGVYVNWKVKDKISLQSELVYNITGVQYETYVPNSDTIWPIVFTIQDQEVTNYIETFLAGTVKGEYNLHYLEMPISVVWQLNDRFGVNLGGRVAYLLNGENTGIARLDIGQYAGQESDFASYDDYVSALFLHQIEEEFDESHSINPFDIGITGGGQFRLNNRLVFALSANYGFMPVQEKSSIVQHNYTNLFVNTSVAFQIGKGM